VRVRGLNEFWEMISLRNVRFADLLIVVLNISVNLGVVIVGTGFGGVGFGRIVIKRHCCNSTPRHDNESGLCLSRSHINRCIELR
jgi:hypothetical protein